MGEVTTVKGEMPARAAGVLIVLYGLIFLVTTLFVAESLTTGIVLLFVCGLVAVLVGIGVHNRNYYAWFAALALTLVSLLGGLIPLALSYAKSISGESANLAVKLLWPVIFFCLLLAAKPACARRDDSLQQLGVPFKRHFAILLAISLTLVTIVVLKATGLGALMLFGFPVLAIEAGLLYVLGQKVQQRQGWSE